MPRNQTELGVRILIPQYFFNYRQYRLCRPLAITQQADFLTGQVGNAGGQSFKGIGSASAQGLRTSYMALDLLAMILTPICYLSG